MLAGCSAMAIDNAKLIECYGKENLGRVREGINLATDYAIKHRNFDDENLSNIAELKEILELQLNTIEAVFDGEKVGFDLDGSELTREESLIFVYGEMLEHLTHLYARVIVFGDDRENLVKETLKEFTSRAREAKKKRETKRHEIIKHKYKGKLSISDTCAKRIIEQLKADFQSAGVDFSISTIKRDIKNILANRSILTE